MRAGMKSIALAFAALVSGSAAASAVEPLSFLLSWRAQAENGGYMQALAKGYYAACGLDMTLRQGGAGIDTTRLLTGGAVDAILVSQNDGVMRMIAAGFPSRAVMAGLQRNPQTLDAHAGSGIEKLEDMRGRPIFLSAGNRGTIWPFLKKRFGFQDDQLRSFTGQFAPFLADKNTITQDFITSGPYVMKDMNNFDVKFFLLADYGYDPYNSLVVVSQKLIDEKPAAVQCLVDASIKGWADFMREPKAGFDEIKRQAPENTDGLMQAAWESLKKYKLVENEDTAKFGVGAMTDERWKSYFDMLVDNELYKADFDYKSAYTLAFLKKGAQR
jgi:NitT/TauT family transport system substrate-binding protein